MDTFFTEPTNVWTRPGPTWLDGTEARSVTERTINTFGATGTILGETINRGATDGTTSQSSRVIDGTGSSSTYLSTILGTALNVTLYPLINSSLNTTETVSNRTEISRNITEQSGDTSSNLSDVSSEWRTAGTVPWSTTEATITTYTNTGLGYSTGIGSSIGEVGNSTATTTVTQLGGWSLGGTSTSSYSTTRSTTGTPSTVSTSRWTTAGTISTFATSQVTSVRANSTITYPEDLRTSGTTATVTTTGHDISPLQDTVVMLNASRNADNYHLGNELWKFSLGSMATSATTAGLFTDLFSSASAATQTLPDYQKFTTASVAVTAITISLNVFNTSTIATGPNPGDTVTTQTTKSQTGPDSTDTISVNTAVEKTWKNGLTWNGTTPSNTVTVTHTFDLGDVGTSLSTYEVGDPATVISETIFTGSVQITGYTSSGWTSATTTQAFAESSSTATRLALHSSASTTAEIYSRQSTTDETLVSSFSSVGTSWQFVGLAKTTTTRVFEALVPTTQSVWEASHHTSVSNYTTNSTATYSGGGITSEASVSEIANYTYRTEDRITPIIVASNATDRDDVWHQGPAAGYGGVGGDFIASSMPVYLRVTAGLTSGGTFATSQSFGTDNLPTALAYGGVTFFPDRTDYPISLPAGAIAARYLSRIASLGDAASVGVTWTATTTAGTTTATTSTAATYLIAGASSISGSFFRAAPITYNTADVRGGIGGKGGYAAGDNALGSAYTVRVNGGHAAWTAYSSDSSVSTGSTSNTSPVTFTVPASLAIVVSTQPVFSMSWGNAGDHHYSSSVPHFPTL